MSKPSPFEPGYVPPPGAKLPPPAKTEPFIKRRPAQTHETQSPHVPHAPVFIPVETPLTNPGESKIENTSKKKKGPLTLVMIIALIIGIGGGFGLGYVAGSDKNVASSDGDHGDVPPRETLARPEPTVTSAAPEPEPEPATTNEVGEIWLSDSEEGVGTAPFIREADVFEWGEPIAVGAWVISATEPRDVTADLLIFDDNNKPAPDGISYRMSELKATYVGSTYGSPAESFSAFYSTGDDAFKFQHCGKIPHDIHTANILQPGESLVANVCIPVEDGTEGLWFMTFDRVNWFGLTNSRLDS